MRSLDDLARYDQPSLLHNADAVVRSRFSKFSHANLRLEGGRKDRFQSISPEHWLEVACMIAAYPLPLRTPHKSVLQEVPFRYADVVAAISSGNALRYVTALYSISSEHREADEKR